MQPVWIFGLLFIGIYHRLLKKWRLCLYYINAVIWSFCPIYNIYNLLGVSMYDPGMTICTFMVLNKHGQDFKTHQDALGIMSNMSTKDPIPPINILENFSKSMWSGFHLFPYGSQRRQPQRPTGAQIPRTVRYRFYSTNYKTQTNKAWVLEIVPIMCCHYPKLWSYIPRKPKTQLFSTQIKKSRFSTKNCVSPAIFASVRVKLFQSGFFLTN